MRLEFDEDVAKSVADRFDGVSISRAGDGAARADVYVRASQNFYAWVFQFAGRVRVAGPEEAVRGYARAAARALGLDDGEPTPSGALLSELLGRGAGGRG